MCLSYSSFIEQVANHLLAVMGRSLLTDFGRIENVFERVCVLIFLHQFQVNPGDESRKPAKALISTRKRKKRLREVVVNCRAQHKMYTHVIWLRVKKARPWKPTRLPSIQKLLVEASPLAMKG
jgi:hypothetical protein